MRCRFAMNNYHAYIHERIKTEVSSLVELWKFQHANIQKYIHTIKLTRGIWTLVRIISTVVYIVTPQGLVDTPQVFTQVITSPRTPIYKLNKYNIR